MALIGRRGARVGRLSADGHVAMNDSTAASRPAARGACARWARARIELVAHERFPTAAPPETLDRIVAFFERHGRPRPRSASARFGPVESTRRSATWGTSTTTPKPGWAAQRRWRPALRDAARRPGRVRHRRQRGGAGRAALGRRAARLRQPLLPDRRHRDRRRPAARRRARARPHAPRGRPPPHSARPRPRPVRRRLPVSRRLLGGAGLRAGARRRAGGWRPIDLPDDHPAWELEAEYLALGILSIVMVASPQRVILGGGVMERAGAARAGPRRGCASSWPATSTRPLLGADIDRLPRLARRSATTPGCWARSRSPQQLDVGAQRRDGGLRSIRPSARPAPSPAPPRSRPPAPAPTRRSARRRPARPGPFDGSVKSMLSVCSAIACTGWSK